MNRPPAAWCSGLGALLLCATALAQDDRPYLSVVDVQTAAGQRVAADGAWQGLLHVDNAGRTALSLSGVDGLEIVDVDGDALHVTFDPRPTFAGAPDERHLTATFVVDFDEDAVATLGGQLPGSDGVTPDAGALQQFVYEHIGDKTYSRGFDLASRVAASGAGDCTEHAVLLAALARAAGHPARVVFGTLVLDVEDRLYGFGHAWTEIHDGQHWQIYDATRPETDPAVRQARYLPVATLDDEGPGYFLSVVAAVAALPRRITEIGNSD